MPLFVKSLPTTVTLLALLFVAALLCLAPLAAFAGEPDDCSIDVLPDGPKDCRYRHIEYASFSYSGGELSVRWPNNYTLEDAHLFQRLRFEGAGATQRQQECQRQCQCRCAQEELT